MSGKRVYDDDDGHVIADMSGIERQRLFIPKVGRAGGRRPPPPSAGEDDRPWESTLTPEERRIAVFAAVKAALFIALVFIIGLGAAIELMVLFW